jgi:hypothetical protein
VCLFGVWYGFSPFFLHQPPFCGIVFLDFLKKDMFQVSEFEFCSNGFVVKFTRAPWVNGQKEEEYSFSIEGEEYLTQQVLNAVKTKRVTKRSFSFCAQGVFNKIIEIQTGVNPSKTQGGKVKIWFKVFKKGDNKSFWEIAVVHHRNILRKNFVIKTESHPVSGRNAWESIFALGQTRAYSNFLKQNFGTEMPFGIKKQNKDVLDRFARNCFIFKDEVG